MRNILKEYFSRRKQTADDLKIEAEKKRIEIIANGETAKRLLINKDFIEFCKVLEADRDLLNKNLLDEKQGPNTEYQRTRYISRIYQIDMVLGKAKSMIWQMENLTEVRTAMQKPTHVRQAHGKQTGGVNE